MVGHACHSGRGQWQCADDIDDRVNDHEIGNGFYAGYFVGGVVVVSNAVVEHAVYEGVDDDVAELGEEDPEIMGPETERSKVSVNPALCTVSASTKIYSEENDLIENSQTYPNSSPDIQVLRMQCHRNQGDPVDENP